MTLKEKKIKKVITKETKKIQKKVPLLEEVDINIDRSAKGSFVSRVSARIKGKRITVRKENNCPEEAVKKGFMNLTRLLARKKAKRTSRLTLQLRGAI